MSEPCEPEWSRAERAALAALADQPAADRRLEQRTLASLRKRGLVQRYRPPLTMLALRWALAAVVLIAVFSIGTLYGARTRSRTVEVEVPVPAAASVYRQTAFHVTLSDGSLEPCCDSLHGHDRFCPLSKVAAATEH